VIFGHARGTPHYWFAWRPVRLVDGRWVWWHGLARQFNDPAMDPRREPPPKVVYTPWEAFVQKEMQAMQWAPSSDDPLAQREKPLPPSLQAFKELIDASVAAGRIL
jgi:hypothetical protein